MGGTSMPGGWMMATMMAAMMLPSSVPLLWRYRRAAARGGGSRPAWLTTVVGAGYFLVWGVFGAAVLPLGAALAAAEMREPALARAVPIAAGVVVLLAGAFQLTTWKARRLACVGAAPMHGHPPALDAGRAWWHGVRLGLDCVGCCAGLMVIPLVVGIMDLGVMAAVTAAVTAERVAPARMRIERAIGAIVVVAGLGLIARAAGV